MVGWSYKWPAVPLNAISQNQTVVSCRFVIHFYACMISFLCSLEMRNYDSIAITSGCSYSNPFQRRAREKLTYTLRTAASVDNYTRTKFNEPAWYLQELPWRKHTFSRNTLFRRWLRDKHPEERGWPANEDFVGIQTSNLKTTSSSDAWTKHRFLRTAKYGWTFSNF